MTTAPTTRQLLAAEIREAVEDSATVTVTRIDGRTHTGTLAEHPTDPDLYVVRTGRRGRPAIVHADDVEGVSFE